LLCSSALNLVLAAKIKNLNYAIFYLKAELSASRGLNPGENAPPIQARNIDGQPATITHIESGIPSIIYIFTPTCEWCSRNLENIRALSDQTKGRYQVIGLSLSSQGLKEYVSLHSLDFPIYTDPIGPSELTYRGGTPRTLVVSATGVISKSWFGAYTGALQREVEEYFKTQLPGIIKAGSKTGEKTGRGCETCDDEKKP
jgi:peroxiredoxin